ncbi:(Fe-S)-binding protein [Achromobacter sp. ES-001]|uniref:(Fe-S)-binding protein n=1 Tax=Achromobacter sp. ES-001 TaxID=2860286 RepID=UPI001C644A2D|nr:(Fe-S)-binding protein [Achromobacter sp. ES-001]QYJ22639.1 (Fe-S)-binding protein [Achromobacter sp. ES-001]
MEQFAVVVTALFWVSLLGVCVGGWRRAALWRVGRAAPVRWLDLLAVPKRYFVDLHRVVARDPYIARTHVATAGGAVAAMVLVAINYGLALYSPVLDMAIAVAALVMLGGLIFVWHRRRKPPKRLSRGLWDRLPWMLGALALGLLLLGGVSAPWLAGAAGLGTVALLALGAWELTVGMARGGPMKHALAGLLHLAFHPRPERFGRALPGQKAALRPLALGGDPAAEPLGVGKPAAFAWNQLLSFDACVQCGKCEAACPAFAAGQPLNPKKLIQDMVVGMAGGSDAAYTGSPMPGVPVGAREGAADKPLVPGLVAAETLWACTTCRACVHECPMLIEHVDAVIDMRRQQTLQHGAAPGTAPTVLANLRETGTAGGYDLGARHHWAVDLNVPWIQPDQAVDVLLIVGEGAFGLRYQRSLRALVKAMHAGGVDFAVLGDRETDTGDIARRLGDEATFQVLATRLIQTLAGLSFTRIVTADPHILHSLRNEYPALGGLYQVQHHTSLLAELADAGRLRFKPADDARILTYHDPCYLGRYNGETEAPRKLLRRLGLRINEMERHGLNARCCGAGGGAALTDIPGERRIPDIRIQDARDTGASLVAVACPNCTAMLEGVVGPRPDVRDIAELVADALEA